MNGCTLLTSRQASNVEVLQNIREKNMFVFGSSRQKLNAYKHFLTNFSSQTDNNSSDKQKLLASQHISPYMSDIITFLYSE